MVRHLWSVALVLESFWWAEGPLRGRGVVTELG